MRRATQGCLLIVIGAVVAWAAGTDLHLMMVKPAMRVPLLATATVLLGAGAVQLGRSRKDPGHAVGRIGVLLAVPFVAMVAVPVVPLSAWTATRASAVEIAPTTSYFDPLPADAVVTLPVSEFVERATFDPAASLKGRTVKLVGFVSRGKDGQRWAVTRIRVQCCAADARPYMVEVVGVPAPPTNSWVEVTGRWVPTPVRDLAPGEAPNPRLTSAQVRPIPAQANPYE